MILINPYSPTQVIPRRRYGSRGSRRTEHVVVLILDPDEAENVADALGPRDGAHRALYEAAESARAQDGLPT